MPTIPLYRSPFDPDASHELRMPGGYEWWYFDAEDPRTDRQIVVMRFDGFAFDPCYARACSRYLRHPTRTPPPLPGSYRCVYVAVHEAGRVIAQCLAPPTALAPIENRDGAQHVMLSCSKVELDLTFRPRWASAAFERQSIDGHRWTIVDPLCDVAGAVHVPGHSLAPLPFSGRGYHDHRWGTAAPGATMRQWTFGRALWDDSALALEVIESSDRTEHTTIVEADASGIRARTGVELLDLLPTWSRWGLTVPETIISVGYLSLVKLRVIDQSAFHLRLACDALRQGKPGGRALLHRVLPRRLQLPLISQTIERRMRHLRCQT